jgi:multiple sugar transport system permease protein
MTTTQTAPQGAVRDQSGAAGTAAPPRARRRRSGQWAAWAFLAPVVVYLIVFYAFPLYRNIELSARDYTVRSFVQGDAPFVGLDNYFKVFQNPTFGPAILHTGLFTVISIAFQFTFGMALAVFFHQNFRLSATLRALFLVPWLLPLIVSASVWAWMLNSESGVINSFLRALGGSNVHWLTSTPWSLISVTIANIWIGIPFNLVLLYSGLQNISADVYEAAELDGATAWKRFWHITFPLLRPVSAITLLLGFVYTLKVFDLIWIITRGGPDNTSTTLATWSYQLSFGSLLPKFGPGSAVGNMLIIGALIAGVFYIRFEGKAANR